MFLTSMEISEYSRQRDLTWISEEINFHGEKRKKKKANFATSLTYRKLYNFLLLFNAANLCEQMAADLRDAVGSISTSRCWQISLTFIPVHTPKIHTCITALVEVYGTYHTNQWERVLTTDFLYCTKNSRTVFPHHSSMVTKLLFSSNSQAKADNTN